VNTELELLAARRQLLVARAALQRLQVTVEVRKLRIPISRVTLWAGIAFTLVRMFRRRG
jgi:hypothetical protein